MEELKSIMLKFVASDWDLLSVPAQQRLDGKADKGAFLRRYLTATEKELAYYVPGNVLEPVNCDYLFSELVNPIFIKDGEQVKVSSSVKYLDQRTKAIQISQFDLIQQKDSNWKIVK